MKTTKPSLVRTTAAVLALCGMANAHIVAVGWEQVGPGSLKFYALHWHGAQDQSVSLGGLIFDGVEYPFTSALQNVSSIPGLNGALVNSGYATWDPGTSTLNALGVSGNDGPVDDWLVVTISGITRGSHTLGANDGPGQLTAWTLDGGIEDVGIIVGGGLDGPLNSSVAASTIGLSRTMTRDVGNRLFRMRSGVRPETPKVAAAPSYSAKGGPAKGGEVGITTYKTCPWEVYGQIYYTHDDQEAQYTRVVGPNGPFPLLVHPGTKSEIFGGNVGIDYEINSNWAVGFAVSAARTDIDLGAIGDVDVDSWALIPYVSYYQPSLIGSADFYADLLYAYGDHDYDMGVGGVFGDTDGSTHQLEFTTGLNYRSGSLVHGPYGVVRWIDGEIDAHPFSGGFDTDLESIATQLGYQVSYPVSVGSGTLVPQGRVAWEHEFEDELGSVAGVPLGDVDEDIAVLGAGIGYYVPCGWNIVLDYEARLGSESQSHYVGLKAGYEF